MSVAVFFSYKDTLELTNEVTHLNEVAYLSFVTMRQHLPRRI